MEIAGYITPRWLLALIGVPLIAGIVSMLLFSPATQFRAEGRFTLVPSNGDIEGVWTLEPVIDSFLAEVATDEVADAAEAAMDAEADGAELIGDPKAAQLGGSTNVEVAVTATSAQGAQVALSSVVDTANQAMLTADLDRATAQADSLSNDVVAANTALNELEAEAGVSDVENQYDRLQADLLALELEFARFEDPSVGTLIGERQEQIDSYGDVLQEWRALNRAAELAVTESSAADTRLAEISFASREANSGVPLRNVVVTRLGGISPAFTAAVPAMLLAFLIVAAGFIWTRRGDLRRNNRADSIDGSLGTASTSGAGEVRTSEPGKPTILRKEMSPSESPTEPRVEEFAGVGAGPEAASASAAATTVKESPSVSQPARQTATKTGSSSASNRTAAPRSKSGNGTAPGGSSSSGSSSSGSSSNGRSGSSTSHGGTSGSRTRPTSSDKTPSKDEAPKSSSAGSTGAGKENSKPDTESASAAKSNRTKSSESSSSSKSSSAANSGNRTTAKGSDTTTKNSNDATKNSDTTTKNSNDATKSNDRTAKSSSSTGGSSSNGNGASASKSKSEDASSSSSSSSEGSSGSSSKASGGSGTKGERDSQSSRRRNRRTSQRTPDSSSDGNSKSNDSSAASRTGRRKSTRR